MRLIRTLILALLLLISPSTIADSGIVRTSSVDGPYRITVFSEPTPLRVGLIDLSVMVQSLESETPVLDATISMLLEHEDETVSSMLVEATREAATNQLLYSAKLALPESGKWTVLTSVMRDGATSSVHFDFDAGPPLPPILEMWPWFILPVIALLLIVMNQWLQRSKARMQLEAQE
ncbi:MAG: hypothetical protein CMJ40_00760 [Phycisphaerae bacterium]|nr:hypothetical protein [Phycisphaerae bacterium]|tara:strand:+ start:517 stop:1047 length:531 start_codon:yes stop_codon:yes gene_type:complete